MNTERIWVKVDVFHLKQPKNKLILNYKYKVFQGSIFSFKWALFWEGGDGLVVFLFSCHSVDNMNRWSDEQHVFVVKLFLKNGDSATLAWRLVPMWLFSLRIHPRKSLHQQAEDCNFNWKRWFYERLQLFLDKLFNRWCWTLERGSKSAYNEWAPLQW